jgi:hypothetical protein
MAQSHDQQENCEPLLDLLHALAFLIGDRFQELLAPGPEFRNECFEPTTVGCAIGATVGKKGA